MRMVAKSSKRMAVLFAIFLAVFSTGIVIAHQCHSIISNQVSMQHNYSDHDSASTAATKAVNVNSNAERLIDTGCATLFAVVLLIGKKFLNLRAPRTRLSNFMALSRDLVTVYPRQVFQLSLSRPELGVFRI
jgi:zinc transporter ZupT